MDAAKIFRVLAVLGIPGVALGVFYLLLRGFGFQFETITSTWAAIIAIIFLVIVGGVVVFALHRYAPTPEPIIQSRDYGKSQRAKLPKFEIIAGQLYCRHGGEAQYYWNILLNLYVETFNQDWVSIQFRQCEATFEIPGFISQTKLKELKFSNSGRRSDRIKTSPTNISIYSSGEVRLDAWNSFTDVADTNSARKAIITISIRPDNCESSISINETLVPDTPKDDEIFRFIIPRSTEVN